MKATNARNQISVSENVHVASSLLHRMKGLLGKKKLDDGESLLIKPCKSIHTIGMKFPIDVIFLDKKNSIVSLKENLPPNRLTGFYVKAVSVLDLPAGTLTATDTHIGDKLEFV